MSGGHRHDGVATLACITPTHLTRWVFLFQPLHGENRHDRHPHRPVYGTSNPIDERGYARPDVLVSTDWLADNLDHPKLRLLESDEDVLLYDLGHIPGAQKIDWHDDLNDPLVRDYVDHLGFERLLRRLGIDQTTTVVLYGDRNNWWATYVFWVFRLFGFPESQIRLLDGGRAAWESEGRPLVTDAHHLPAEPLPRAHARRQGDPRPSAMTCRSTRRAAGR